MNIKNYTYETNDYHYIIIRRYKLKIGCNYWASHAGTKMWELWDENIVSNDLKLLADSGCEMIRAFPIWELFQPIEICHGAGGWTKDIYMHGKPLPNTYCGKAGVDEEMIRRFRRLAEIAHEYKLSLRVPIVTGWMSGSFFCPPALDKTHILTDPFSQRWMVKYIRCFVHMLKDCPAIEEWELGNECNNLQYLENTHIAWLWTNLVASTIRLEDPTRKVASGMHGLRAADEHSRDCAWSLQIQGEICDRMTPHPYPHSKSKLAARIDTHNSIRSVLESTVEMLYYGDVVDLPYSVEEIGTFASSFASESLKAEFLRGALYNCWAHGASDFLWWCAFDQAHLKFPPYSWSAFERELGLFTGESKPKQLLESFIEFKNFKDNLPIKQLPPFQRDAVCVSTRGLDFNEALSNASSSLLLAKQNHFDLRYRYTSEHEIDAPLYIVPSIKGDVSLYGYEWESLMEKVQNGAILYVSMDNCAITNFNELFGVEVSGRELRSTPAIVEFDGEKFTIPSEVKTYLNVIDAEVLACEADGNPVYVRNKFGKGWCYLLTLPLEKVTGSITGAFHKAEQPAWRKFYAPLAEHVKSQRRITCDNPLVTLTEHPENDNTCWVVAVNNSTQTTSVDFTLAPNWKSDNIKNVELKPFTGKLLKLTCK